MAIQEKPKRGRKKKQKISPPSTNANPTTTAPSTVPAPSTTTSSLSTKSSSPPPSPTSSSSASQQQQQQQQQQPTTTTTSTQQQQLVLRSQQKSSTAAPSSRPRQRNNRSNRLKQDSSIHKDNNRSSSSTKRHKSKNSKNSHKSTSLPATCTLLPLILTSEKKRGVYECDYCHTDISQVPRIRCAECPDFDSCLECFAGTRDGSGSRKSGGGLGEHDGGSAAAVARGEKIVAEVLGFDLGGVGEEVVHDDTHRYRVADSTRYWLFPSLRGVVLESQRREEEQGVGKGGGAEEPVVVPAAAAAAAAAAAGTNTAATTTNTAAAAGKDTTTDPKEDHAMDLDPTTTNDQSKDAAKDPQTSTHPTPKQTHTNTNDKENDVAPMEIEDLTSTTNDEASKSQPPPTTVPITNTTDTEPTPPPPLTEDGTKHTPPDDNKADDGDRNDGSDKAVSSSVKEEDQIGRTDGAVADVNGGTPGAAAAAEIIAVKDDPSAKKIKMEEEGEEDYVVDKITKGKDPAPHATVQKEDDPLVLSGDKESAAVASVEEKDEGKDPSQGNQEGDDKGSKHLELKDGDGDAIMTDKEPNVEVECDNATSKDGGGGSDNETTAKKKRTDGHETSVEETVSDGDREMKSTVTSDGNDNDVHVVGTTSDTKADANAAPSSDDATIQNKHPPVSLPLSTKVQKAEEKEEEKGEKVEKEENKEAKANKENKEEEQEMEKKDEREEKEEEEQEKEKKDEREEKKEEEQEKEKKDEKVEKQEKPEKPEKPEKEEKTEIEKKEKADKQDEKIEKQEEKTDDKLEKDNLVLVDDPKNMWTVEEDLRMLDAISTCGLGNWADIAEIVSNGKSAKRCMERYIDDYLGRYGHILPKYTLVEVSNEDDENRGENSRGRGKYFSNKRLKKLSLAGSQDGKKNDRKRKRSESKGSSNSRKTANICYTSNVNKNYTLVPTSSLPGYEKVWPDPYVPPLPNIKIGDDVGRDLSYRAENEFVKATASVTSRKKLEKIRKEWTETRLPKAGGPKVLPPRVEDFQNMAGSELAGFMPRRGDFDVEWDNEAEAILAEMDFAPNDHPGDRALKIKVIEIYNSKLDEREKRKKFLVDHKLLDYRKRQVEDQMRPADERDLVNRMRLFARFHTPDQHDAFIKGLLKAKRLRKEIAKLQMCRRMGITSLAEAERFELDTNRREAHKIACRQKEIEEERMELAAAKAAVVSDGDGGGSSAAAGGGSSLWKTYKNSDRKTRKSRSLAGDSTSNDGMQLPHEQAQAANDEASTKGPTEPTPNTSREAAEKTDDQPAGPSDSIKDAQTKQDSQDVFNVRNCPGFELLSTKEAALCQRLELLPNHYIAAKKALIQESFRHGIVEKECAESNRRSIVKIDIEKRHNVIDFILQSGWISSKPKYDEICCL